MEILSLGPSRTATASMAEAYEVLGIPTYHGYRLITYRIVPFHATMNNDNDQY